MATTTTPLYPPLIRLASAVGVRFWCWTRKYAYTQQSLGNMVGNARKNGVDASWIQWDFYFCTAFYCHVNL